MLYHIYVTGRECLVLARDLPLSLHSALRLPPINGIKVPIGMHLPIAKVLPQRRHKHPDLINTPPKPPRHQRKAHRLASPAKVLVGQPPDLLVPARPWATCSDGHSNAGRSNVDVAPAFCIRSGNWWTMPSGRTRACWRPRGGRRATLRWRESSGTVPSAVDG